jgi:hypothetical protein
MLKLDEAGPIARIDALGDRNATCTMKLGMSFQSFLGDCVEVFSDGVKNASLRQKLLGNASRAVTPTSGTWMLDVDGVSPNFGSERFDELEPPLTARATEMTLDVRASGKVLNDYTPDGATRTLTGSGAVYREYARLVQEFLHGHAAEGRPKFPLGSPECLLSEGADPAAWKPAFGCTGMEQFITPADPATSRDPGVVRLSSGIGAASLGITSALKAGGTSQAVFCTDPAPNGVGSEPGDAWGKYFQHCTEESGGLTEALFTGSQKQVLKVLGGGNIEQVPADAREPKFYLRMWTKALVKYLRAAAQLPADLSSPELAALLPADEDITIATVKDDLVKVKYKDRFELTVLVMSANVHEMKFR